MKLNKNWGNYYYLDTAIQLCLILVLVLVPIYFTSMIHNSFTTEKLVIFRIGVLLMLALSLIKLAYFKNQQPRPWYIWLVPAFGVVGILSTYLGINPIVSLWGIHLRMDGLVNMLLLVVFFGLIYLQLDSWAKIKQVLQAIVIGGIIPTVYAIMQKVGADPIEWKEVVVSERVFGTLGNPAYLGAYLLFTIPLGFYFAVKTKGIKKIFFGALVLAQIIVLIFTWTRAAYLGVGIELTILFLSYFWFTQRKRLFYVSTGLVVAGIVFVAILNMNTNVAKMFGGNRYIERLSHLTQVDEGTGKDRVEMWKIAGKVLEERPLLGAGLSQYVQYFNKYYPNYMDGRPEKDRYSNYSHNLWLDTGAAHGLIGMGLLIAIYIIFLVAAGKKINKLDDPIEKFVLIAIITAIIGYLAQAMFNIETVVTWVYSYGLLSILAARVNLSEESDIVETNNLSPVWQIVMTVTAGGAIVLIYFLGINLWSADKNYFYINNSDLPMGDKLVLAEEAKQLTPYFEFAHVRIADFYSSQIDFNKPKEAAELLTKTVEQINEALKINPLNYKNYLSLATIYASWAQIDPTKISSSEQYFAKAKTYSPDRLGLHWAWGNANIDWNRLTEAKKQFDEAVKLNPEVGETYFYLAKVSYLNGNTSEAEEYLKQAQTKGFVFDMAKFYGDLALIAYKQKRIEAARVLAEKANGLNLTEMSAMIEIQANLELDKSEAAEALLNKYSAKLPNLKKKFEQ